MQEPFGSCLALHGHSSHRWERHACPIRCQGATNSPCPFTTSIDPGGRAGTFVGWSPDLRLGLNFATIKAPPANLKHNRDQAATASRLGQSSNLSTRTTRPQLHFGKVLLHPLHDIPVPLLFRLAERPCRTLARNLLAAFVRFRQRHVVQGHAVGGVFGQHELEAHRLEQAGMGLSPRVRGNRAQSHRVRSIWGSIPACAGEPE